MMKKLFILLTICIGTLHGQDHGDGPSAFKPVAPGYLQLLKKEVEKEALEARNALLHPPAPGPIGRFAIPTTSNLPYNIATTAGTNPAKKRRTTSSQTTQRTKRARKKRPREDGLAKSATEHIFQQRRIQIDAKKAQEACPPLENACEGGVLVDPLGAHY